MAETRRKKTLFKLHSACGTLNSFVLPDRHLCSLSASAEVRSGSDRKNDLKGSSDDQVRDSEEDEKMQTFFVLFEDLCEPQSSPLQREQLFVTIFIQLAQCQYKLQLEVIEILSSLLERKPDIMTQCRNLLPLVIRNIDRITNLPAATASATSG